MTNFVAAPLLTGSGNSYIVSTKEFAEASVIPASVAILITGGYSTVGDGGQAYYVQGDASEPGGFTDAGGTEWTLARQRYFADMFGAKGDGVTDDTAAIQAGMDKGGSQLAFWGGKDYLVSDTLNQPTAGNQILEGVGAEARIVWDTNVISSDQMIYSPGNNCGGKNIVLVGGDGGTFGDIPSPGNLWRFGDNVSPVSGTKLIDATFIGGLDGLTIYSSLNATLTNVECRDQYRYNCQVPHSEGLIVLGSRFLRAGINEGLKFGFGSAIQATTNIILSDILIEDCGKLDPTTANHQEGLDFYCPDLAYVTCDNLIIRGCGNGCVEIKTENSTFVGNTDTFEQISFSDCVFEVTTGNQPAVAINWNPGTPGVPNADVPATKGRRFVFDNVNITHNPAATNSSGCAYQVMAYSEIQINGGSSYGAHTWMVISGAGGFDAVARDIKAQNVHVRAVSQGIYFSSGGLDGLDLNGVDIECANKGLVLGGGSIPQAVDNVVIRGDSRIVTTGTAITDNAIDLRCARNTDIRNCYLESEARVITENIEAVASLGGKIIGATLKCRSSAVLVCNALYVREGTWEFTRCNLDMPLSNCRGWQIAAGVGTVKASDNRRNMVSAAEGAALHGACGGALGDVFPVYNVAAGGIKFYNVTSASDSAASVKADAAIAP